MCESPATDPLEAPSRGPGAVDAGAPGEIESRRRDSNPQPPVYKTGALPIAPRRQADRSSLPNATARSACRHTLPVPTGAHLVAFLAATVVIVAIPGPSLLFTIGRALTVGRRDALLTVAGNAVGLFVQSAAVAVGLGALIAASSTGYAAVKLAGAAYLGYLGVTAIRDRHHLAAAVADTASLGASPTAGKSLTQGLLVGLTNPKTIVFLASLLPQFIDHRYAAAPQILTLGAVFATIAAAGDSIWALGASRARAWFARSPERLGRVGAVGGAMMIGLGVAAALSGRPE